MRGGSLEVRVTEAPKKPSSDHRWEGCHEEAGTESHRRWRWMGACSEDRSLQIMPRPNTMAAWRHASAEYSQNYLEYEGYAQLCRFEETYKGKNDEI